MNLVWDVGDEAQVSAFDDDIVVGGKLVGDRVQARTAASRARVVFSFNSMSSKSVSDPRLTVCGSAAPL